MSRREVIGAAVHRHDGPDKVSGRMIYATDVALPGMVWAKALRSPIARGRIIRVDTRKAAALPGVCAVITGADVQGLLIGRKIYDMPILAAESVRFTGEKVAAVAAETEAIAEQALESIEIEYTELDPLLDPIKAMEPSAPLLHPDVQTYRGLPQPIATPSNVFIDMTWKKGDVEAGFAEADLIVENTFTTAPVHQAYIEPHACVVRARPSGGGDVWACSKVPFALREQVAIAFGRMPEDFIVHPCAVGGCFGGKGDFMDVPICYALSVRSGRPVKMVMDYAEEFIAGNPRHAAIIRVKTGVKKEGRLVAHQMQHVFDSGAYAAFKPQGYLVGPRESAGPYRIPHVLIQEKIVYTNKIPCGHMRAPGDPQGFFANESQMDAVAARIRLDPVAFRKKNLMRDGEPSPTGHIVPHIKGGETLDDAVRAAQYHRRKRNHVGRGVAVAHWLPLGGECRVAVMVDASGKVTVAAAMIDQGAGTYTAMRQIAAQELKVPAECVNVEVLDTSRAAPDTGVGASRATRIFGHGAREAAGRVREQILEIAAGILNSTRAEMELSGAGSVRARRGPAVTYADVVKRHGSAIRCEGAYRDFTLGPQAAVCAQVAEVEVDVETGQIMLKRFTTAHGTGKVINPLMHQGQIDGGVVMGVGYALMERLALDGGRVVTTHFGENKIPSIRDIPTLTTVVREYPVGNGPYGAMSIGEPPVIPAAAAIANAIHDAVGVRICDLPITAEKVLEGLKARRGAG